MAIVISGVNNTPDKITASDGASGDLLSGVNFNSELTVPVLKLVIIFN